MQKVKVVSGYVPLPVLNITETRFKQLGALLHAAIPCPKKFYDGPLTYMDLWMHNWEDTLSFKIENTDPAPDPARFPNPRTKTLSNFVMHQKMEWMALAALEDTEPDVFVWIDYGVLKQEGMNQQIITDFIYRLERKDVLEEITAPGIRPDKLLPVPEQSWDRFCGSVVIVPRRLLFQLHRAMKRLAMAQVLTTHKISIESNTLAEVEFHSLLPFRWYQAWWGAQMFTNFR